MIGGLILLALSIVALVVGGIMLYQDEIAGLLLVFTFVLTLPLAVWMLYSGSPDVTVEYCSHCGQVLPK